MEMVNDKTFYLVVWKTKRSYTEINIFFVRWNWHFYQKLTANIFKMIPAIKCQTKEDVIPDIHPRSKKNFMKNIYSCHVILEAMTSPKSLSFDVNLSFEESEQITINLLFIITRVDWHNISINNRHSSTCSSHNKVTRYLNIVTHLWRLYGLYMYLIIWILYFSVSLYPSR